MFSDNKNRSKKTDRTSDYTQEQNRIAQGSTITGDVEGEGVFRIEGTLKGNLKTSKKIVIGQTGLIEGDVICGDADIEGTMKGTLRVDNVLNLKANCNIEGEIITQKLSVEPGANLNGTCTMKKNPMDNAETKTPALGKEAEKNKI